MNNKTNCNYKKTTKKIVEYIITNRLFISYVVLSLIATICVRAFTIGSALKLKPFLTDLGFILVIGGFGYFVKPQKQFKYFFAWLIIFNLMCLISSIYYRFFTSFASIGELATIGQTETVTGSIFDRLKIADGIYILIPIIFYLIHKKLLSSSYYYFIDKIEKSKKMVTSTVLIGIIFLGYTFGVAKNSDYSRLSKQWNRNYIVERFGIIMYQLNDFFQFLKPQINSLFGQEKAKQIFDEYFANKQTPEENKYTGILKGKNIIFIHMESMQSFLMDLSFNGQEVTPNLNKLAKEGMHFTNFYPQVSTGTSSDTEFTLLSGLMPASSGTVFVSYYDRNYFTIPKYLHEEKYFTFSMHGNLSSMWNRNKAHPSLGYEKMYFRESFEYNEDDVINLGINDELFFKQAMPILENIEDEHQNYMGTIITLSNHSPFKLASKHSNLDLTSYFVTTDSNQNTISTSKDYLSKTAIGEYIKSANYADTALGEFLDYIKKSDHFKDTIFVFYGDHDAKLSRNELNYLYNLNPETGEIYDETNPNYIEYDYYAHELNKKTPLIIWTKNESLSSIFKGEITYTMGMYNVAATILNMYGIYNKYNIGEDIFSVKENNIVVYPNGNVLTNKVYYNNSTNEYKVLKEDNFTEDYIKNISTIGEKRLEVSNAIIVYNLLENQKLNGDTK